MTGNAMRGKSDEYMRLDFCDRLVDAFHQFLDGHGVQQLILVVPYVHARKPEDGSRLSQFLLAIRGQLLDGAERRIAGFACLAPGGAEQVAFCYVFLGIFGNRNAGREGFVVRMSENEQNLIFFIKTPP